MARELSVPEHAVSTRKPTHEQIAQRAYQIFLERGRPEGHDQEHWLEAEAQLNAAIQAQPRTQAGERVNAPAKLPVPARRSAFSA